MRTYKVCYSDEDQTTATYANIDKVEVKDGAVVFYNRFNTVVVIIPHTSYIEIIEEGYLEDKD